MATTIGILLGIILLSITMFMGGGAKVFFNPEAIMITLGGTIAATLVSYPLGRVINIFKLFIRLFQKEQEQKLEQTVSNLVHLGHTASQESIYSLEKKIKSETDRYIQIGLKLLIEDAPPRLISRRFEIEAEGVKNRHQGGIQLFSFMAKASPSFGLVGTLIGLINLLRGVGSDMSADTLGPSMAVALVTTLYGSLLSFLVFMPASEKLKAYSNREFGIIRIIREAILMIREGQTSRELEQILNTYLPLEKRKSVVDDLLAKQYKAKTPKKGKSKPIQVGTAKPVKAGAVKAVKSGTVKSAKAGKAKPTKKSTAKPARTAAAKPAKAGTVKSAKTGAAKTPMTGKPQPVVTG